MTWARDKEKIRAPNSKQTHDLRHTARKYLLEPFLLLRGVGGFSSSDRDLVVLVFNPPLQCSFSLCGFTQVLLLFHFQGSRQAFMATIAAKGDKNPAVHVPCPTWQHCPGWMRRGGGGAWNWTFVMSLFISATNTCNNFCNFCYHITKRILI